MTKNVPTRWSLAEIKSATLGFHRNRIVGEAIGSCYNFNFQCTLADDSSLAAQLTWQKRFNIIRGTARGIMYLHEDSRLGIIHRDLKASIVLLDHEMNPKISDFGMSKIFSGDQNEANTNRVVGTYGYMAPEYAMEGQFSVRSDVFSFGVVLLEIITGRRNYGFHLLERGESLLIFAWKLWSKGEAMELIEEHLLKLSVPTEVLKCIQIGLLCVQADPVDGTTVATVVAMLGKDTITMTLPAEPAFYVRRIVAEQIQPNASDRICSVIEVTISYMSHR
ncbi:Cysteine-rich receptor-like protein kinase 6 [Hibiscus syriacus]|uniref:non-specific serine/threonine protein kinase n=1 Tax=Hibiscus syriacus TaxID=106335 RepID=A0A6A3C6N7_HIBSY|nr:Cysteine-rich receptor-like protein kinase 6 [Hibiscus syriacus]